MNYPAFFTRNLLQTHSRSLQQPKPCPIQIFTHMNTGTSRRDKKDKMAKRNQIIENRFESCTTQGLSKRNVLGFDLQWSRV